MARTKAKSVVDVILGEAKAGSWQDMVSVASVIANRAAQLGVSPEDVISAMRGGRKQFSAYGIPVPPGNEAFKELAQQAWDRVTTIGPVHDATFFATPAAVDDLPSGLEPVAETEGHQFFNDPAGRSILTAQGYVKPDLSVTAQVMAARSSALAQPTTMASVVAPASQANVSTPPAAPESITQIAQAMTPALDPIDIPGSAPKPTINTDMNPILGSLHGTSSLTRPSAVENMSEVLADNYQSMQNAYGMFTGKDLPAINDGIAKTGTSRETNRRGSMHFQGKAIDFGIKDLTDFEKQALDTAAKISGFNAFGYGAGVLHVDTGPQRSWGYRNSTYGGIPIGEMKASALTGKSHLPENISMPFAPVPTQDPRKTDETPQLGIGPLAGLAVSRAQPGIGPLADFNQTPTLGPVSAPATTAAPATFNDQFAQTPSLSPADSLTREAPDQPIGRSWGPNAVAAPAAQGVGPLAPSFDIGLSASGYANTGARGYARNENPNAAIGTQEPAQEAVSTAQSIADTGSMVGAGRGFNMGGPAINAPAAREAARSMDIDVMDVPVAMPGMFAGPQQQTAVVAPQAAPQAVQATPQQSIAPPAARQQQAAPVAPQAAPQASMPSFAMPGIGGLSAAPPSSTTFTANPSGPQAQPSQVSVVTSGRDAGSRQVSNAYGYTTNLSADGSRTFGGPGVLGGGTPGFAGLGLGDFGGFSFF